MPRHCPPAPIGGVGDAMRRYIMSSKTKAIRTLNDEFRRSGNGGRLVLTRGVWDMGLAFVLAAVLKVRTFDTFTKANDPHGEHDFGSFAVGGETVAFKIDYYDQTLTRHSDDAADPEKTVRVLTLMLIQEY